MFSGSATAAAGDFGSIVGTTDFDTTYLLDPAFARAVSGLPSAPCPGGTYPFWFSFFDDDADGTVDLDDPVYLSAAVGAGSAVAPLDLRISVPGFTSGTQVRGIDGDNALGPLAVIPSGGGLESLYCLGGAKRGAVVGFTDLDSSGGYTTGDELYLNVNPDIVVSSGDVRLTDVSSRPAGSRVGGSDADLGSPMLFDFCASVGVLPCPGTVEQPVADFFDTNGDLVYNRGDILYLDTDAAEGLVFILNVRAATMNDVRLMPFNGKAFGSVVGPTDFDTTYVLDPGLTGTLLTYYFGFFDDDADGTVDLDDPVYLAAGTIGGTAVAPLDVRISVPGFTNGTLVRGTDGDNALGPLSLIPSGGPPTPGAFLGGTPIVVVFTDLDSSGGYTAGDQLYINVNPDGVVSSGDIRLTDIEGRPAGSRVGAADADQGTPVVFDACTAATPTCAGVNTLFANYFDVNGDFTYNRGDIVYLDSDVPLGISLLSAVTVNDVRLTPFNGKGYGSVVGPTDFDTTYFFDPFLTTTLNGCILIIACPAAAPPFTFAYFDDDADGTVDLDDPVYLAAGGATGGAVAPLDVRISVPGFTAGTQVRGIDGDNALGPLVTLPSTVPAPDGLFGLPSVVAFTDLDSSGGYTLGDEAYLNVNPDAVVSSGDIRLTDITGRPAGSRVGSVDADLGSPVLFDFCAAGLIGLCAGISQPHVDFFDMNGDLVYGRGDVVYLDTDSASGVAGLFLIHPVATVNDVHLMPFPGAPDGSTPSPTVTPTETQAPTPTQVPPSETMEPEPTTASPPPPVASEPTSSSPSPGFALVAALAAVAAVLVVAARRRRE